MCRNTAHLLLYLYGGMLQTCEIYIIYALKHKVFGIVVKNYFVTLQLLRILASARHCSNEFGTALALHNNCDIT